MVPARLRSVSWYGASAGGREQARQQDTSAGGYPVARSRKRAMCHSLGSQAGAREMEQIRNG